MTSNLLNCFKKAVDWLPLSWLNKQVAKEWLQNKLIGLPITDVDNTDSFVYFGVKCSGALLYDCTVFPEITIDVVSQLAIQWVIK